MRKLLFGVLLVGLTVPVFAYDDRDYDDRYGRDNGKHRGWYKNRNRDYRDNLPYRDDRYGNYGYRDDGRYGSYGDGRYGSSAVSATLNNLSRISSRGFVDGHE